MLITYYELLQQYPDYLEDNPLGYTNPRQVRGLGVTDYGQLLLTLPNPLTKDDELYIRNRIRWLFKHFFHTYNEIGGIGYWTAHNKYAVRRIRLPKPHQLGNAFWKENLVRLVTLNSGTSIEERLSKADALRSLGDFKQALLILKALLQTAEGFEAPILSETTQVSATS